MVSGDMEKYYCRKNMDVIKKIQLRTKKQDKIFTACYNSEVVVLAHGVSYIGLSY